MPDRATVAKFKPYTADELDAIARQLSGAYGDAEKQLLDILARGNITSWREAYTAQQLAQIDAVTSGLTETAARWTQEATPELYKRGLWVADGHLEPGGLSKYAHPGEWTPMDLGMTQMHEQAIKELAENAAVKLGNANSYCAQRIKSMVNRTRVLGQMASARDADFAISAVQWGIRDASLEAMTQAFAQGETVKEAEKRFLASLRKRGITSFTDAAGRDWNMERYAQMVARTVAQEAQTHGQLNRLMENGQDIVEVIGRSVDGRADSCDQYEGKLLSITGKSVGETHGGRRVVASVDDARGTSHLLGPNCVHVLVPFIVLPQAA